MTSVPLSRSQKNALESAAKDYHEQLLTDPEGLAYLESRGLGSSPAIETLRFGLVRSPRPEHERMRGRLAIPFIGPRGNIYDIRFRCIDPHDHKDKEVDCPKYLGCDGVDTRLYNLQSVAAPTDYIFLAEGELDAATLFTCGWPAVGVPGANNWKKHYSRILAGFSRVVLVADGDEAGRKLAQKVQNALRSSATVIMCKQGDDINALFVREGREGLAEFIREGMSE